MPAEPRELRVRVDAEVADGQRLAATRESVVATVEQAWSAFGLVGGVRIAVEAGMASRIVDVELGGEPLALSARTARQVVVAGTGELRRRSEPDDHVEWMRARLGDSGAPEAANLLAGLVHATLVAGIPALVAADASRLARERLPSSDPRPVERAAAIIALAGELGVAPSQLDLDELAIVASKAEGEYGRHQACDELVRNAVYERLSPVLEMTRATLRRLTTGPRPLGGKLLSGADPAPGRPRAEFDSVSEGFNVTLPSLRLRIADDILDDRLRVRFGSVATAEHLVLPDGHVAVEGMPGEPPRSTDEPVYYDPVFGGAWPVSPADDGDGATWESRRYGPAELAVRCVRAELQRRVAWWVPEDALEVQWGYVSGALGDRLRLRIPLLRRRLLADGVAARDSGPIIEALVGAELDGDASVASAARRARAQLGGAVLGPAPVNVRVRVLRLEPDTLAEATSSNSVAPLLREHPDLATTTGVTVVLCAQQHRSDVQRLVRSLADVVLVATPEEVEDTVLETVPALSGAA